MTDRVVLQFSTSTSFSSSLIRKFCHSAFSHVDIVLPDGNLLGASDQGPHSTCVRGNAQGVAIRIPEYQEFGIRRQATYLTDKADRVLEFAHGQLGKPFDSDSVHAFLDDTPYWELLELWKDPEKWFCAELIAWCLDTAGYWSDTDGLFWPKNRISPNDLLGILGQDRRWINRETFPRPIEGLMLGRHER